MPASVESLALQNSYRAKCQFFTHYGSAWAVGLNTSGQLGIGTYVSPSTPVALPTHTWSVFTAMATGTGAVKSDGTLWTSGTITSPLGYTSGSSVITLTQVGVLTDWAHVTFGENTGYGVKSGTGALWAWRVNGQGQFGIGTTTNSDTPVSCGINVSAVSAGSQFVVAIKTDGTLWSAGYNNQGQLGLGHTTTPITTFTQVGVATNWVSLSCGQEHTAAIDSDGKLWLWGQGQYAALGFGGTSDKLVPTQLGIDTDWVEVACGMQHTVARKSDGRIYSWGSGWYGRLGQGDTADRTTPTQIGTATDWLGIAANEYGTYAHTVTTLYACGDNTNGALGLGDTLQRNTLTPLTFDFAALYGPAVIDDVVSAVDLPAPSLYSSLLAAAAVATDDISESWALTLLADMLWSSDALTGGANTTASLIDAANLTDIIQQAINQIIADTASGTDTLNLGAALALVEIAQAAETQASTYNSVMLVAELIATLEAYNAADSADVTESGVLTDAFTARVQAIAAVLEASQAVDTNTVLVHVMQSASDTADAVTAITSSGSILNALLSEGAVALVRLNIGGELFTGWVLNTDTLAPSEYQFADRQFNSACKHGDRYLMAADDGIYQFTDEADVETVMTYIKTGKTDFGSDLRKYIPNSYMVYSASGDMVLKVTTSEFGKLQTRNYRMVPPAGGDTTDTRRFDIGKGIRSRYWQFELVGDGVDCDIDEIGMLPVVLSRRI